GRQQKEGNWLIALGVRRLRLSAQRDDPGFPQYWNVLDRFVVDPPETELFVRLGVIVQRDSVEPAASRIPWRRAPVDADSALRMHVGYLGAESRQRVGRVHLVDRREVPFARKLRPLGRPQASGEQQKTPPRLER